MIYALIYDMEKIYKLSINMRIPGMLCMCQGIVLNCQTPNGVATDHHKKLWCKRLRFTINGALIVFKYTLSYLR